MQTPLISQVIDVLFSMYELHRPSVNLDPLCFVWEWKRPSGMKLWPQWLASVHLPNDLYTSLAWYIPNILKAFPYSLSLAFYFPCFSKWKHQWSTHSSDSTSPSPSHPINHQLLKALLSKSFSDLFSVLADSPLFQSIIVFPLAHWSSPLAEILCQRACK